MNSTERTSLLSPPPPQKGNMAIGTPQHQRSPQPPSQPHAFFVKHSPYYTGPTPGLDSAEMAAMGVTADATMMQRPSMRQNQVVGNRAFLPESTFEDLLLGGYGDTLDPVALRRPTPSSSALAHPNRHQRPHQQPSLLHERTFLRAAAKIANEIASAATKEAAEKDGDGPSSVSLGLLLALDDENRHMKKKPSPMKEDMDVGDDDDEDVNKGRRFLQMIGLAPRMEGGRTNNNLHKRGVGSHQGDSENGEGINNSMSTSCASINTDYGNGEVGGASTLRELRLDALHLEKVSGVPTKGGYSIAQQGKRDFDTFAQAIGAQQQPAPQSSASSPQVSYSKSKRVDFNVVELRVDPTKAVYDLRRSDSGGFEMQEPTNYGGTSEGVPWVDSITSPKIAAAPKTAVHVRPSTSFSSSTTHPSYHSLQLDSSPDGPPLAKQLSQQQLQNAMRSRHWRENLPPSDDNGGSPFDRAERLYDGVFTCCKGVISTSSSPQPADSGFDPVKPLKADKYPILIQTLVIVGLAVAVRVCGFLYYDMFTGSIELGEIGMVFTGLFFFQGIVFNGVKSDLADAEKLPNSVVITLERIEDIFLYSARSVAHKRLRFSYAQELLIHFARTWREYLVLKEEATYYHCETILRELILLSAVWDVAGGDGMSGVGGAVSSVRAPLSRAAIISRTTVLPAAQALLMFFVVTASSLMYLVKFKSVIVMTAVMVSVLTVIWFSLRMISAMQDPFNICPPLGIRRWLVGYMATVQIFPLNEYIAKLELRCADQKIREEKLFRYMEDNEMRRRLLDAYTKEIAKEEEQQKKLAKKKKNDSLNGGGAGKDGGVEDPPLESSEFEESSDTPSSGVPPASPKQ